LSKEKYPKEKTPECRLFPALLAFAEGFRKGLPAPPKTSGIPAAPLRADLGKSCGARRGLRDKTNPLKKFSFYLVPMRCVGTTDLPALRANRAYALSSDARVAYGNSSPFRMWADNQAPAWLLGLGSSSFPIKSTKAGAFKMAFPNWSLGTRAKNLPISQYLYN